jgi:hypothetical protein
MTTEKPSRRGMMLAGATFAGGCFAGLSPRTLLAMAQDAGLPLPTGQNLNTTLATARAGGYAGVLGEAADDLLGFLENRFALTTWQRTEIASLPDADRMALSAALRAAAMKGQPVQTNVRWQKPVNVADPALGDPHNCEDRRGRPPTCPQSRSGLSGTISVAPLHNWQCDFGQDGLALGLGTHLRREDAPERAQRRTG